MKFTGESGPCYSVPLIDTLPIGPGSMQQAMPSYSDLRKAGKSSTRVVAGYEVLLSHYLKSQEEVERLKAVIRTVIEARDWSPTGLQEAIGDLNREPL